MPSLQLFLRLPSLVVALSVLASTTSDQVSASDLDVYFETEVQNIFRAKCSACHNGDDPESGLDLTTAAGVLRGSEAGRVVRPGKPDQSRLIELIDADKMPPAGEERLARDEIETIRRWVASGGRSHVENDRPGNVTEHDIIPLLHLRCVACHGGRRREAELDLRSKESILRGGESGPACVPGNAVGSLILRRIHAGEMPPRRDLVEVSVKPMEADEIQTLTHWIEQGLPTSDASPARTTTAEFRAEDRNFWSFRPPRRPPVPRVRATERVRNPIDSFILRQLEANDLSMSPEAEPAVLMRRLFFDLTGLPPTPDETRRYLEDPDPQAYERLVDRLLDSPRYGERWARHWLDVAGYADSEGAQNEDRVRRHIWRYRDYVIRAFNADKPYSRFLMEQIAGDEMANYQDATAIDDSLYDNLVATGFLRTAPDRTFANITNFVPDRLEVIADEMHILGSAVLGLTLKCARCHAHKFDPIPQQDYYKLTAIFKDAFDEHDWLKSDGERTLPHVTTFERQAYDQHEAEITQAIADRNRQISNATEAVRARLVQSQLDALALPTRTSVAAAWQAKEDERTEAQQQLIAKHLPAAHASVEELEQQDSAFAKNVETWKEEIETQNGRRLPEPRIRALWSRGEPSPTYLLERGDYLTPGSPVQPGIPAIFESAGFSFVATPPWPGAASTGRRLAFARWLTQDDHPLTTRVIVNRLWLHHFGRGIVNTPGNFGRAGSRPTHPDLLDWLATEFVARGWSMKAMHRLIVTSSTYRQSSQRNSRNRNATGDMDPDGALFSRMPLRRVEAEVLRDSMLLIAGKLNETRFGPADPVDVQPDGLVRSRPSQDGWRRSIYVLQRRTQIPTLLQSFDFPQMGPNCLQRDESLVAPQALHLMNDKMVHDLAGHFAERVLREAKGGPTTQIDRVYLHAFARSPTEEERQAGLSALAAFRQHWLEAKPDDASRQALTTYCHAIFNLAEFVYVQ